MAKYKVKNCPAIKPIGTCRKHFDWCSDITNCVIKQIIEKLDGLMFSNKEKDKSHSLIRPTIIDVYEKLHIETIGE